MEGFLACFREMVRVTTCCFCFCKCQGILEERGSPTHAVPSPDRWHFSVSSLTLPPGSGSAVGKDVQVSSCCGLLQHGERWERWIGATEHCNPCFIFLPYQKGLSLRALPSNPLLTPTTFVVFKSSHSSFFTLSFIKGTSKAHYDFFILSAFLSQRVNVVCGKAVWFFKPSSQGVQKRFVFSVLLFHSLLNSLGFFVSVLAVEFLVIVPGSHI